MQVDAKLKLELERAADTVHATPDAALESIMGRVRTRRIRRGALIAAAAVALAAGAAIGPGLVTSLRHRTDAPPAGRNHAPAMTFGALAGSYETMLRASDRAVERSSAAGRWQLDLHQDGTVDLDAPRRWEAKNGLPSGVTFTRSGSLLETNAFFSHCRSTGAYELTVRDGALRFAPVGDTCPYRRVVFSSAEWHPVDEK